MAVQAQFGAGGLAGCLLPYGVSGGAGLAEEQLHALLSAAAAGNKQQAQQQFHCAAVGVASAAQSELTCNNGGVAVASRKRGRDGVDLEQYHHHHHVPPPSSSAALLPFPNSGWTTPDSAAAAASTSGRGALVAAELLLQQQVAEVDELVHAGCERLRLGLERARKRHCEALVARAARALREKERELDAARRRNAELEERLRQATAETQAWCGLASSNEAAVSGLRATIDALLLRQTGVGAGTAQNAGRAEEEGFGESGGGADDDAESCCFVDRAAAGTDVASASPAAVNWACRACGAGEASVLVLLCRHLCLCKACEPRTNSCPVCAGAKNASLHIAPNC